MTLKWSGKAGENKVRRNKYERERERRETQMQRKSKRGVSGRVTPLCLRKALKFHV